MPNPLFWKAWASTFPKCPAAQQWVDMLSRQLTLSYEEKPSYAIIWLADDEPVGHSNVSKIEFGVKAYMHLHLWQSGLRQKGMGAELVRLTLPHYFKNLQLQTLFCEPYALNPAPNKTLEKVGFRHVETYTGIPGWLNFEQPVNVWELTRERFEKM
jgi:RimJ/RimL family protein N-acetyltransferase